MNINSKFKIVASRLFLAFYYFAVDVVVRGIFLNVLDFIEKSIDLSVEHNFPMTHVLGL